MNNAYERLGALLERYDKLGGVAKIRTGAGYSTAHIHDGASERMVTVGGNVVVRAGVDGVTFYDSCGWHTLTTGNAMRMADVWISSNGGLFHRGHIPFARDESGRETLTVREDRSEEETEHDYAQRLIREHRGSTVGEE